MTDNAVLRAETPEKKERNIFLDLVKGVVIFLMLWGHCIQYMMPAGLDFSENTVYKLIYTFHMPCFALISGYLLWFSFNSSKTSVREALGKRVISLAVPIVLAQMFNAILCHLPKVFLNFSMDSVKTLFLAMLPGGSLWFFWSILAAVVVIAVARSMSNRLLVQAVYLVLFIPLIYALPNGTSNLFMYPYVVIGYYFCGYKKKLSDKVWYVLGYLSIPLFVLLFFLLQRLDLLRASGGLFYLLAYVAVKYMIGLVGSAAFISVLGILFGVLKKAKYLGMDRVGKNSLEIYALSCSLLSFYLPRLMGVLYARLPALGDFFADHIWRLSLAASLIVAVLYCFIIYGAVRLLQKIKVSKFVYGR